MNHLQLLISRSSDVCYTKINHDEIVILNPADENLYYLNKSAVDLWIALEAPKTISELTQLLVQKYAGQIGSYQQDVIEWVNDNQQKGLLTVME